MTRYQQRRDAGLCISCPNSSPNNARCDACRKKRKDAHAEHKANNRCVECKKSHDEPGSRCSKCKEEHVRLYKERKAAGVCPHCGGESIAGPGSHCKNCQKKNRKRDRKKYAKLRRQVVDHYSDGTRVCVCCGEGEIEFLQVDHIEHRGGAKHRKEIGIGGTNLYTWLRKHNFPPGFQVLCANCNHAKGRLGVCPHEVRRRREAALDASPTFDVMADYRASLNPTPSPRHIH